MSTVSSCGIFDAILNFVYLSGFLLTQTVLQVAQEIESEAKFQNDFLNQLVFYPLRTP